MDKECRISAAESTTCSGRCEVLVLSSLNFHDNKTTSEAINV